MKIEQQDIRAALLGFLELLESTDQQASVELLELWLGQLAFLQHFAGDYPDDGRVFAPSPRNPMRWNALIETQFSDLAHFNASAVADGQTDDPVADLAQVAEAIAECLRRWENTDAQRALWYFKVSYQVHWGAHLRNLQIYLHHFYSVKP